MSIYKDQIELFSAVSLRDGALASVAGNSGDWFDRALRVIGSLERGQSVTGESIRHIVEERIGAPHHHNAYGSLISHAVKAGMLHPTGTWVKMRDPKSHARRTPMYCKT